MRIDSYNQDALNRLVDTLSAGRAIGFIGAGSSSRIGYPTWTKLVEQMAEQVQRIRPGIDLSWLSDGPTDPLWQAEELRDLMGKDEYATFMRSTFREKESPCDQFHCCLVTLPFRHLLTTNFDPVLEKAHEPEDIELTWFVWDDQEDLNEFIRHSDNPRYSRRLVYVHGRFNRAKSLVLTERDYNKRYQERASTWPTLWGLSATKPFVFVGFGLTDLDLMAVFRDVRAKVGGGEPHHFALIGLAHDRDGAALRRYLRRKYGIEPVFYEIRVREESDGSKQNDHSHLEELMQDLLIKTAPISKLTKRLLESCMVYKCLHDGKSADPRRAKYLRAAAYCLVVSAGTQDKTFNEVTPDEIVGLLQHQISKDHILFEALQTGGRVLSDEDKKSLALEYARAVVNEDDNPNEIHNHAKALFVRSG